MACLIFERKILVARWFWITVIFVFLLATPAGAQERPEALEGLSIHEAYVPSEFKEAGRIERIVGEGRVVVLHRSEGPAFFASAGDPVHENDAVFTLGRIRCRILFEDRNVVTMAPESDLIIDEVVLDSVKSEKRSRFEVTRGRAVFYAIRLFRYRDVRLHVKTPTATVGVRGTKFGTEIEKVSGLGEAPESLRIASSEPVYLAADSAAGTLTRIYVAMGKVNVVSSVDESSRDIGENEFIETDALGLGPTRYDPGRVRSFVDGVEGPMVSGEEGAPASTGAGPTENGTRRYQDDTIRQLEQMEDAKGVEVQREFELEQRDHPSEPSGHPSPPPHGGSHP